MEHPDTTTIPPEHIEEGGWQKPVAPPSADSRPAGLPPASPSPANGRGTAASSNEQRDG